MNSWVYLYILSVFFAIFQVLCICSLIVVQSRLYIIINVLTIVMAIFVYLYWLLNKTNCQKTMNSRVYLYILSVYFAICHILSIWSLIVVQSRLYIIINVLTIVIVICFYLYWLLNKTNWQKQWIDEYICIYWVYFLQYVIFCAFDRW